jgi:hypothetical protein
MGNPRNSNTLHILVNVRRERLDRRGGRMPKVIEEEEEEEGNARFSKGGNALSWVR